MLVDTLKSDTTKALKAGEKLRLGALRYALSEIGNAAIAKYAASGMTSMTDTDVAHVLKIQVKRHRESIEAYEKAGRKDLVDKEQAELKVLESYLPKELSDDELKAMLTPIAASGEVNFGLLMKQAMAAVAGQAEGGRVSSTLRSLLPHS